MLCLLSCRLSWDLEVKRVYPKLSSIGFMMCASGADRVVWVMTGIKGLTDVEVDTGVDIVNGGVRGFKLGWILGSNAEGGRGCGHPLTRNLVIYHRHRRPILADWDGLLKGMLLCQV